MQISFCVGSDQFWKALYRDIQNAGKCILIQTYTFEGDSVGKMLAELLCSKTGINRMLLIDSFSRHFTSDYCNYGLNSLLNSRLRTEMNATLKLCNQMTSSGIRIKFVNRLGPLFSKLQFRNHKKIIIIDNAISYLGGINFSEHNFSWFDMMARIESHGASQFLHQDFIDTWNNNPSKKSYFEPGMKIVSLNGQANGINFRHVTRLIRDPTHEIFIISPYLSHPFVEMLSHAQKENNVDVTVLAPLKQNNYLTFMAPYLKHHAIRAGFNIRLYLKGMFH